MTIVLNITWCTSLLSLISTIVAVLIGITQKVWKKRDGLLFFNMFAVDVIYSCSMMTSCVQILTASDDGITSSNFFVFTYVLSWASQCVISLNRYTMVSYPFSYKTILTRARCCVIIATAFTVTYSVMFTSIGVADVYDACTTRGNASTCLVCEVVFPRYSRPFLSVILSFHVMFVVVVYVIECWLWKTAKRHRHHFHSLTSSVNGGLRKDSSPSVNENSRKDARDSVAPRRGSITQTIRRKMSSFSHQRPPVQVHGTPVFYLAAHLFTLLAYMVIGIVYMIPTNHLSSVGSYSNVCMVAQLLLSLRPMINVGNHLSTKSLKRFTKLIQKVVQRDSRELFTEYYYENDANAKMLKRKEEIRLRPRT